MRFRNMLKVAGLAAVLGVGALSQSSEAALLAPGTTQFPAVAEPDPVGGTVIQTLTSPFSSSTFSGSLTSRVISGDATNVLGGLTFVYEISSSPNSLTDINRLTLTDFSGFLTDVSYQVPTSGLPPTLADRGILAGMEVGFSFHATPGPGSLTPGLTSALLVVQTNAPVWVRSPANVINGSVATPDALGPAIPEPGSLALLGAAGLLVLRRRR